MDISLIYIDAIAMKNDNTQNRQISAQMGEGYAL